MIQCICYAYLVIVCAKEAGLPCWFSSFAVFPPESKLLPNIPITTITAKTSIGSVLRFMIISTLRYYCFSKGFLSRDSHPLRTDNSTPKIPQLQIVSIVQRTIFILNNQQVSIIQYSVVKRLKGSKLFTCILQVLFQFIRGGKHFSVIAMDGMYSEKAGQVMLQALLLHTLHPWR